MKYVTLNNGLKMPILEFGVFQIIDLEHYEQSLVDVIKSSYRLIDTATSYFNGQSNKRNRSHL